MKQFQLLLTVLCALLYTTSAFVVPSNRVSAESIAKQGKKDDDLDFLAVRDLTRDEMKKLNEDNEKVMQAELWGMTIFSLVISVPLLYLVWVGFFSETVEFGEL